MPAVEPAAGSIRPARDEDAPAMLAVINASNRASYRAVLPASIFRDPFMTLDDLRERMHADPFYVCREGDRVVGVGGLAVEAVGVAKITRLYVHPDCQRRGIGTAMVLHMEGRAREMGLVTLKLHVLEAATWANRFYDRLGYAPQGALDRPGGRIVVRARALDEAR